MAVRTAAADAEPVGSRTRSFVHRALKRTTHAAAYHLVVRRALLRNDARRLQGFTLHILPGVFHPSFLITSRFFASFVSTLDLRGRAVMDLGCGSGLQSLAAASAGALVLGIDVNRHAVECTRRNAKVNSLENRVAVLQSDLFDRVPREARFDVVLTNPPFYPMDPRDEAERAWNAGRDFSFFRRFACEARSYIVPSGRIIMILSNVIAVDAVLRVFADAGYSHRLLKEKRKWFERLSIHEFVARTEAA